MKSLIVASLVLGCFTSCDSISQEKGFAMKKRLSQPLKEVSGIVAEGNSIWAISDKPHPVVFKLNYKGDLQQEINLTDIRVSDVEAITSDGTSLFVGDIGDNEGSRSSRNIYKIAMSQLGNAQQTEVNSEKINFTFPDTDDTGRKKDNEFDCEAMLAYGDSLYLFTKRRSDDQSELYVLPAIAGTHVARLISKYNTRGLITDAAINPANNQVVLTGYGKGHDEAFVWILTDFRGNDFFSGRARLINFSGKNTEWQVEGVTFKDDNTLFFSCEETKKIPATLYEVSIANLDEMKKIVAR